jgi:hypothetical protein
MINMQTISDEIAKLEESQASFPVCKKLADLYIVRDHLMQKQGQSNYGYYERGGNSGNNSNYAMYNDGGYYTNNRMTMDGMDNRPPRMSNPAPSMR